MTIPRWIKIALVVCIALYVVYTHLQFFGDITLLGSVLMLEIIAICFWKYDQLFFPFILMGFVWAGMPLPLQGTWTAGRWAVLAAGAVGGYIIWMKHPRRPFGTIHLLGFFCVCAAFVSATVSPFLQMAFLKASSLLLLFLYCSSGGRLAVIGRETRFFESLIAGAEIVLYLTTVCYFVLGMRIWGNPNSLGAATSIGLFPILLWGWLTTEPGAARTRRLCALLLCTYLVFYSMARAGMFSITLVTLVFCFGLRQYKLLAKAVALIVVLIAMNGIADPSGLGKRLNSLEEVVLYKGHREEGVLGSRKSVWEKSVQTIKEHPWFGTGYGTSPTGEDPGTNFGKISSSSETVREHGSSYMMITEWVGLLGAAPFAAILLLTLSNIWRVCAWMARTGEPRHYSIPVAMVLLSGLVHANFEDWLFAVGAYPSVYFWFFAFILADLVPAPSREMAHRPVAGYAISPPPSLGTVAPNPALSNR